MQYGLVTCRFLDDRYIDIVGVVGFNRREKGGIVLGESGTEMIEV